jgi:hypothetical protein
LVIFLATAEVLPEAEPQAIKIIKEFHFLIFVNFSSTNNFASKIHSFKFSIFSIKKD